MRVKANRICIVTSRPYPQSEGGEEGYVRQFTHFLASKSVPHTVVSSARLPTLPRLETVNALAFFIPIIGSELYTPLWSLFASFRIVKINSNMRIDMIYAVDTRWSGFGAAVAARLLGVPLIVHALTNSGQISKKLFGSKSNLKWRLCRASERVLNILLERSAAKVIVSTEADKRFWMGRGVPQYNILVAGPVIGFDSSPVNKSGLLNESILSKILDFIRPEDTHYTESSLSSTGKMT